MQQHAWLWEAEPANMADGQTPQLHLPQEILEESGPCEDSSRASMTCLTLQSMPAFLPGRVVTT